jgi:hypothetical protein
MEGATKTLHPEVCMSGAVIVGRLTVLLLDGLSHCTLCRKPHEDALVRVPAPWSGAIVGWL